LRIVGDVAGLGIRRLIVLDLAQVGTGQGIATLPLCQQIAARFPDMEIATGGGVSTPGDLADLARAGIDAALVASALHDGRIGRSDIDVAEATRVTANSAPDPLQKPSSLRPQLP
jgi:phosphoribosylformimino-5-aminoimidazole carboxamide ribotide isomerase